MVTTPPPLFPLPYGQTVLRLRAPLVTDPYSGEATMRDWTNPGAWDRLVLEGVAIAPSSITEDTTTDSTRVVFNESLYGPVGVDVKAEDRIADTDQWPIPDGVRVFDCAGDPEVYVNPFDGWQAGSETHLTKVE